MDFARAGSADAGSPDATVLPHMVLSDACIVDVCDVDPVLTVVYVDGDTPDPDYATDLPWLQAFATAHNTSLALKRPLPELLRYSIPQVLASSVGPDVISWQSLDPFTSNCLDLSALALQDGWAARYPAALLRTVTFNGKILGLPQHSNFWGIWYDKTLFARLGITSTPRTWAELLALCALIRAADPGVTPVAISHGDGWQGMTWWEMAATRLGGADWWDAFLAGEVDCARDPVLLASWQHMLQIMPFMSRGVSAATDVYITSITQWVAGEAAMILSWGIARNFPAYFGRSVDDFDFFPFPALDAELAPAQQCEFSGSVFWAVNAATRQPALATEYVRFLSGADYNAASANNLDGNIPAQIELRAAIQDPILKKGAALLDGAPRLLNFIDAVLPAWAERAKPAMVAFFTTALAADLAADLPTDNGTAAFPASGADNGTAALTVLLGEFETIRQEVQLQRAVDPVIAASANTITIACATANASIYYSIAAGGDGGDCGGAGFFPYLGPLQLDIVGTTRVCAYASRALMSNSETVERIISIQTSLRAGDVLLWTFSDSGGGDSSGDGGGGEGGAGGVGGGNYNLVTGLVVACVAATQLFFALDNAIRQEKRHRWVAVSAVGLGLFGWTAALAIQSSVTFLHAGVVQTHETAVVLSALLVALVGAAASCLLLFADYRRALGTVSAAHAHYLPNLPYFWARNGRPCTLVCYRTVRHMRKRVLLLCAALVWAFTLACVQLVVVLSTKIANTVCSLRPELVFAAVVLTFLLWWVALTVQVQPTNVARPTWRMVGFTLPAALSFMSSSLLVAFAATWTVDAQFVLASGSTASGSTTTETTENSWAQMGPTALVVAAMSVALGLWLTSTFLIPMSMSDSLFGAQREIERLVEQRDAEAARTEAEKVGSARLQARVTVMERRAAAVAAFNPNGLPEQQNMPPIFEYLLNGNCVVRKPQAKLPAKLPAKPQAKPQAKLPAKSEARLHDVGHTRTHTVVAAAAVIGVAGATDEPSLDEWLGDEVARGILIAQSREHWNDHAVYFVLAVRQLKQMTDDMIVQRNAMARYIYRTFVCGNSQVALDVAIAETLRSVFKSDRLHTHSVFDAAVESLEEPIMDKVVARFRERDVGMYTLARRFLDAAYAQNEAANQGLATQSAVSVGAGGGFASGVGNGESKGHGSDGSNGFRTMSFAGSRTVELARQRSALEAAAAAAVAVGEAAPGAVGARDAGAETKAEAGPLGAAASGAADSEVATPKGFGNPFAQHFRDSTPPVPSRSPPTVSLAWPLASLGTAAGSVAAAQIAARVAAHAADQPDSGTRAGSTTRSAATASARTIYISSAPTLPSHQSPRESPPVTFRYPQRPTPPSAQPAPPQLPRPPPPSPRSSSPRPPSPRQSSIPMQMLLTMPHLGGDTTSHARSSSHSAAILCCSDSASTLPLVAIDVHTPSSDGT